MRKNIDIYRSWAPLDALWTNWAKPVLFTNSPGKSWNDSPLEIPDIVFNCDFHAAVIIDLPAEQGVLRGLAMAKLGYRPIPLYNGVYDKNAVSVVKVLDIVKALWKGAELLEEMNIPFDAPPAFLLDSNRLGIKKEEGMFDNRWLIFAQDMPSGKHLLQHNIDKIIVMGKERDVNYTSDLADILYRYQEKGLSIYRYDKGELLANSIHKPYDYRTLFYRSGQLRQLKRNSTGGFGAIHYYGGGG